jgi:hypothetical protein
MFCSERESAISYQRSTISFPNLLVYDLDLLIDHLIGEPVNRHMHPVMLLAFASEISEDQGITTLRYAPG